MDRNYGNVEGLPARIDQWIETLSRDKALPWIGLGLIDDLKAVKQALDGPITNEFALTYLSAHNPHGMQEYDL